MFTHLGAGRLQDLLFHLHEITGLHFSIHNLTAKEIYAGLSRSPFCDLIANTPEGYERCYQCDLQAIQKMDNHFEPYRYRCHAGIIDIVIPVRERGQLVTVIQVGQFLDADDIPAQMEQMRKACSWHHQKEALEHAFLELPRLSPGKIKACLEIMNACVSEVRLEGLFDREEQTDVQRLIIFINNSFARKLTLDDIAQALAMSKSKLCALACQISPDMTVMKLLTKRRIQIAKRLLLQSTASIRDVAEQVGIDDYNYFTKVFKNQVGLTPTAYRKEQQEKETTG